MVSRTSATSRDRILEIRKEDIIPPTPFPMPDIILRPISSGMSWIAFLFKRP
jgi:hypothetical protein